MSLAWKRHMKLTCVLKWGIPLFRRSLENSKISLTIIFGAFCLKDLQYYILNIFVNLFTCNPTFICVESSVETIAFDLPFLINTASRNLLIFWSIKIDVNRSNNMQNFLIDYSQFKSRDSDSHIFHAEGIFRKFIHFFSVKADWAKKIQGVKSR